MNETGQTINTMDTGQYQKIFSLLKSEKQGLLVSGGAGTGKTTFIEYLGSPEGIDAYRLAEKMAIVAPTGVAAMRAGGSTIHSMFEFPPESFDYQTKQFAGGEEITPMEHKKELFAEMHLLVIDEVSMVRADLMDAINLSLQVHRGNKKPFGGLKVLFIGDIFQLQPVVNREDMPLLQKLYLEKNGMFFFESLVFDEMRARDRLAYFELNIPYRFGQTEEERNGEFPAMLNRLRHGNTQDLSRLNKHLNRPSHWQKLLEKGAVMLTGLRRNAESYNEKKLGELEGEETEFIGEAEGKCANYKNNSLPAPIQLLLKKGARVIFVRNHANGKWRNGTLGTVEDFGSDDSDEEYISVELDSGETVRVKQESWEMASYRYDPSVKNIIKEEDGKYTQFPLMLSWALTIHRAQGQTLDLAVVNLHRAFSAGQTYVALSRCRQAKHLGLMHPLKAQDLICHKAVNHFYDTILTKYI